MANPVLMNHKQPASNDELYTTAPRYIGSGRRPFIPHRGSIFRDLLYRAKEEVERMYPE